MAIYECRTAKASVEWLLLASGDWMGISPKLLSGVFLLPVALHKKQEEDNCLDLVLASEKPCTPESYHDTDFWYQSVVAVLVHLT